MFGCVARLDDGELAALEDELDFYSFTGIPSQRMLTLMDKAGMLDDEWRGLLASNIAAEVPAVSDVIPRAIHRRDAVRRPKPRARSGQLAIA